jgi:hypothetical protein
MDTNLDRYRTAMDNHLKEIKQNLALFPVGNHRAYFALLSVYQLATEMSEIQDLSRGVKLRLGHEICERLSTLV